MKSKITIALWILLIGMILLCEVTKGDSDGMDGLNILITHWLEFKYTDCRWAPEPNRVAILHAAGIVTPVTITLVRGGYDHPRLDMQDFAALARHWPGVTLSDIASEFLK